MEKNIVIDVQQLSKSFGKNQILKGINLQLQRGENLAVLGKSGTGKSVLIKCIAKLILPDSGIIVALDVDVLKASPTELAALRGKIGFLFQSGALYDSMTVKENLEFPLIRHDRKLKKDEIDHRVIEALKNVGLEKALMMMPSELSGGMKKRIGLARTLILEPEIVLYDEPTTGLDPVTSAEISELINEIQEKFNTSAIIITHDLHCASVTSNRIVMLNDGIVFKEGNYDELSKSEDKWIRSFFKN
jgi:phospholipid/cholesterol/gamma-HCH transport system ATP-binding protein